MSCSVKNVLTQNLRKVVSVNGVVVRHDEISREHRTIQQQRRSRRGPPQRALSPSASCSSRRRAALLSMRSL